MEKSFDTRVAEAKATVDSVTAEQAHQISRAAPVAFVDPRPGAAIAATGLIPGAFAIPLDDIAAGKLPAEFADKSARIITTCQAGCMGAVAAHELAKQGFANVSYLDGGTQAWLDAGFSTETA